MATFPAYALPLFEGFTERPDPAVLRTEMEAGPPKQALLVSRVMVARPMRFLITSKSNYQAFKTWFADTIHRGADWFDWVDPLDGQTKSARIQGGTYDPQPQRKDLERWIVSLTIETWED